MSAVLPMEKLAPADLLEPTHVPEIAGELAERGRITSVQRGAAEGEAHPGDWIAAKLLFVSIALIVAMNIYDFVRGLLGF